MHRTLRLTAATAAAVVVIGVAAVPRRAAAQATDPCSVLVCMSGRVGNGTPSGGCQPAIAKYFSIQVWSPHYRPGATAARRLAYLQSCPGASLNSGWVAAIQAVWGTIPWG